MVLKFLNMQKMQDLPTLLPLCAFQSNSIVQCTVFQQMLTLFFFVDCYIQQLALFGLYDCFLISHSQQPDSSTQISIIQISSYISNIPQIIKIHLALSDVTWNAHHQTLLRICKLAQKIKTSETSQTFPNVFSGKNFFFFLCVHALLLFF